MDELRPLTEQLLNESTSSSDLARVCADLQRSLSQSAPLGLLPADPIALPPGLALAPRDAASCLLDTKRTVAFVRGVALALAEARRRVPTGELEVVYAGTGPFAPLVLPLLSVRPPRDVRFTFLDIHPHATAAVEALVDRLGLRQWVRQVVCADASSYHHPTPIDLVVTETLQRSLAVEPFVAIVRNLRQQLAPAGQLVPERTTVDLVLIDALAEQASWAGQAPSPRHQKLAQLFEVTAHGPLPGHERSERSSSIVVAIPATPRESWIALATRLDVFGHYHLGPYESGLTVPEILWPLSPARAGEVVEFHYALGPSPGFRWRLLEPGPSRFLSRPRVG